MTGTSPDWDALRVTLGARLLTDPAQIAQYARDTSRVVTGEQAGGVVVAASASDVSVALRIDHFVGRNEPDHID